MNRMQNHFRDDLQSIHDLLARADEAPGTSASGFVIISIDRLTDLVERLYNRILDLERVQNERDSD